jgi:transposase-like protein
MKYINKEAIAEAIKSGEGINIDEILNEFKGMLKEVYQAASEVEITEHLGYEKHSKSNNSNYRNGYNQKTLKSKYGNVDVKIPRDRDSTFEPKIIPKRQTLIEGTEDLILSLYTKGLSIRDIKAHLDDLYGYELSEQTISNITDKIIDIAKEWQNRPLNPIYPIIFMDATVLNIRVDRVVKNIACYLMIGVTLEGKKEILGIWIGENETSKYWLSVLNEIKNRGVQDVLIFAIDGLNGFNEAIKATYPKAEIQRCIVHQIRNSLKFVSWKDRKSLAKDLRCVYSANTEDEGLRALEEFHDIWGKKYPNIYHSWKNNWSELSTFFKYPEAIRKLIYTTNPIESLNSTIKKRTKSVGSFPTIDSAFKLLYLTTQEVQTKWNKSKVRNWSEIYPQLCIFFEEIMIKYTG